MRSPFAVKFGIIVLVLFCLASAVVTLIQWRPLHADFRGQDAISRFERELAPLKEALRSVEAVGYLGDHSDPTHAGRQRRFQQTQYILAPIMVTDKRPTRYFVGVWNLNPEIQAEIEAKGLVLVQDFGNEIRLFERKAP